MRQLRKKVLKKTVSATLFPNFFQRFPISNWIWKLERRRLRSSAHVCVNLCNFVKDWDEHMYQVNSIASHDIALAGWLVSYLLQPCKNLLSWQLLRLVRRRLSMQAAALAAPLVSAEMFDTASFLFSRVGYHCLLPCAHRAECASAASWLGGQALGLGVVSGAARRPDEALEVACQRQQLGGVEPAAGMRTQHRHACFHMLRGAGWPGDAALLGHLSPGLPFLAAKPTLHPTRPPLHASYSYNRRGGCGNDRRREGAECFVSGTRSCRH